MPRKTLTALEPVTLPIDASAYWSWIAATLLANVSGQTKKGREEDQIYEQALHFLSTHVAQLILFKSNLLSCNYEHVTFSVKITFSHLKTQISSFEDLTDRTSLGTRWICKLFFFICSGTYTLSFSQSDRLCDRPITTVYLIWGGFDTWTLYTI